MSLIYSMLMSVDGYVEDEHGRFDFAAPDEELNPYINQLTSSVGTYLYGRRMYESMVYWETAHTVPNLPQFCATGRGNGRRPRRSFTPEPSPSRAACERGLSASSIPT